jgi:hypothetical protein
MMRPHLTLSSIYAPQSDTKGLARPDMELAPFQLREQIRLIYCLDDTQPCILLPHPVLYGKSK